LKALWVLSRLRVVDVVRSRSATFAFLGLPVLILLVLAAVFSGGHPFEVRRISVVQAQGDLDAVGERLAAYPGVRVESEPDLSVARRKLETRATDAVLEREADGALKVAVGSKDELWGRGVAGLLPRSRLVLVTLSHFGYVHYLFPGLLCSSVMFAGLFGMGYAMARYRQNAFLKKLATTPLGRGTFVLAQILGRGSLVAVQASLLLVVAIVGFGVRPSLGGAVSAALVCAVGLFVFSGIGFALASLIETEAVVSDVISGLTLPFTLFSGVFFPLDSLPPLLASVCALLPSTLMVDAVRSTLLYGAGFTTVASNLGGLLLWGVVTFGISVRLFRWHG
jgi:ABC-type multidrug transport system permease subunit